MARRAFGGKPSGDVAFGKGGIEVVGMDKVVSILGQLQAIGSTVTGAELRTKTRREGGAYNNAEIARKLADDGRDFFTATDADTERCAATFAAEVDRGLQHIASTGAAPTPMSASAVATSGFRRAMRVLRDIVAGRLDSQVTSDGNAPEPVSPGYAAQRAQRYGVPEDIVGKATGQLLENVATGEDAVKIIAGRAGVAAARSASKGLTNIRRRFGRK